MQRPFGLFLELSWYANTFKSTWRGYYKKYLVIKNVGLLDFQLFPLIEVFPIL